MATTDRSLRNIQTPSAPSLPSQDRVEIERKHEAMLVQQHPHSNTELSERTAGLSSCPSLFFADGDVKACAGRVL